MLFDSMAIKALSVFLVLIGALFLALSLPPARKISCCLPDSDPLQKKWRVIVNLMLFFFLGYLFFDLILFFNLSFPLELVTAGVFFAGALFVFLVINISRITITERQKVEKSLHESELCFQKIFNSVYEAIIILDPESGVILGVNDMTCSIFGINHEEACGKSIGVLEGEHTPLFAEEWKKREATGRPWTFEWLVKGRDGNSHWLEGNAHIAKINGEDRLLVSMRDITRRKRLEERLARLNRCFLGFTSNHDENIRELTILCGELMGATCALYNKLEAGMLHTKAHWNAPPDFKTMDEADGHLCTDVIMKGEGRLYCVRNLGYTAYAESDPNVRLYDLQTYIGMPVKCNDIHVGSLCVVFQNDYSPDEEDEKFLGILASAIGVEEERRKAEEALHKAHGELESRVLERTAELATANEQLRIDIAERKKAEEALWKSESILRKVFEAIPDMMSVIDRDLRILHSNWQGGYEYVAQDIRNSFPHCYDAYYPGQGKPCEECHVVEVFRSSQRVTREKYNPQVGIVEVRAFPIYDDSGEVIMVAEYIRNITERKRLEEELNKAHKLESLGVLAGGIAHDFNNLLTGILGNISLAKAITDPKMKIFSRLEEAEKAVWRARDLTQQLMTFSRGGAPVKKTASIKQIVMDSASFVLRGSNVRCEFAIGEDTWPVEVDEGQMSQVINNLIINADQSMVDGGIIDVTVNNITVDSQNEPSLKEGRYVKISIRDHGEGIPEANIHRIFDPYFTTKQKGSGLGLATVYSIIKNHDGHVRVESKVYIGTTFHIFIPASENGLSVTMEKRENPLAGSGRILVMDDEEIIRDVSSQILVHLGYDAEVCCDGVEALEIYRKALFGEKSFSAVIMDLTIPGGMGGKETIRKLQEIDNGVIGIVSSGYCNDPILANYADYGFRGIVEKPYSMEKLGKVLHDLLAGGGTIQQVDEAKGLDAQQPPMQ